MRKRSIALILSLMFIASMLFTPPKPTTATYSPTSLDYNFAAGWNGPSNNPIPSSSITYRNIVVNPSAEDGTLGWSGSDGVTTTQSYYGAYSFQESVTGSMDELTQMLGNAPITASGIFMFACRSDNVLNANDQWIDVEIGLNPVGTPRLHYVVKQTVPADIPPTDYYFLIGTSEDTWYYQYRNLTADCLFKGLAAPTTFYMIYLTVYATLGGSSNTGWFDAMYAGNDAQTAQGDVWRSMEFEDPRLTGVSPNEYPVGWTAASSDAGTTTTMTWSSPYLHYWALRINMPASAGSIGKVVYYTLGANPPDYLAFAVRLLSAADAKGNVEVMMYDSSAGKALWYTFGTGAAQRSEDANNKVIHETITTTVGWHYKIKTWKADYQTKFGVAPTEADTWRLYVSSCTWAGGGASVGLYDAFWMGSALPVKPNCFMFSDFRNPAWSETFSGVKGAATKYGFDYNGLFMEASIGASATAVTQVSLMFPITGYGTRSISYYISELGITSLSGTASIKVESWVMGSSSWGQSNGFTATTLATSGQIYYGPNSIVTQTITAGASTNYVDLWFELSTAAASAINARLTVSRVLVQDVDTTAPSQVTLSSPADNSNTSSASTTFTWNAASDTGGDGLQTYQLQTTQNPNFITSVTTTNETGTSHALTLADGIWYWRVRAVDKAQNVGSWSLTWRLIVGNVLLVYWDLNPASFYRTDGSQTYRFHVGLTNGTTLNYAAYNIVVTLDGAADTAYWSGSGIYYTRTITPSAMSLGSHTIQVSVTKTGFPSGGDATTFTAMSHILNVVWVTYPSSAYQPSSLMFSFQVKDENNNILTADTIADYLDNNDGAITFSYYGATQTYNVSLDSAALTVQSHTILVYAYRNLYYNTSSSKAFTVLQHTLTVTWISTPPSTYQGDTITFRFYVKDDTGNNVTTATITAILDGVSVGVVWSTNHYYWAYDTSSALLGNHTFIVTAAKTYYAQDTSSKVFRVLQHSLQVTTWTGSTKAYYPGPYTASLIVKDDAGNWISPDSVTCFVDLVFPITPSYNGSGQYLISIDIGLYGTGNHTVTITATKLLYASATKNYVFNLQYRGVTVTYIGSAVITNHLIPVNYTYRVTLDSWVSASSLTFTLKIDGTTATHHNYTIGSYVFVYVSENLTSGVHTIELWAFHPSLATGYNKAYVTVTQANALLPVVAYIPYDQIELWGDYSLYFYVVDNYGVHTTTATVIVSVYNFLGLRVYRENMTADLSGNYHLSVTALQVLGYGVYSVQVYIAQTGYTRTNTAIATFQVTSTGYTLLSIAFSLGTVIVGSGAVVQFLNERRGFVLGRKAEKDVFDHSSTRFTIPLLAASVGMIGNGILVWVVRGLNFFTLLIIPIVALAWIVGYMLFMVMKKYEVYGILGFTGLAISGGALYWAIFQLGLGWETLGSVATVALTWLYLLVEALMYRFNIERTWFTQVLSKEGETVTYEPKRRFREE